MHKSLMGKVALVTGGSRGLGAAAAEALADEGADVAVSYVAKGVARDLGGREITVNIIQPGIMPTGMAAAVRDKLPDAIMDLHPIRRIATLEEVSAIVCFLAGPHGGYITGGVIDVAGGLQI